MFEKNELLYWDEKTKTRKEADVGLTRWTGNMVYGNLVKISNTDPNGFTRESMLLSRGHLNSSAANFFQTRLEVICDLFKTLYTGGGGGPL